MIIRPKRYRDSEPSLIEDVVMPHAEPFTDVSREEVRRRSVGNLQRQYDRSRHSKAVPFRYVPSGRLISPNNGVARTGYTVVPPLQSLPDLYSGTTAFLPPLVRLPGRPAGGSVGKLTTGLTRIKRLGASLVAFLFGWLPKRYTASSGLTTDWDTAVYRTKIIIPSILVLGVLALLIFGVLTAPRHYGAGTTDINSRTLPITVSSSGGRGRAGSGTGSPAAQSAANSSPSSVSTPAASAAAGTGTLTGGMGGGPAGTGTGTGSGSALPLNLTETIPPTNVQAGGKNLLNTSGTSLTVN